MKNKYEIRGDVTVIFINHKGKCYETLIDTEDLKRIMAFRNTWFLKSGGYVRGNLQSKGREQSVSLHRMVMDTPEDMEVDHINNDPLDNRKSMLRNVTHKQNMENTSPRINKYCEGVRGVTWCNKSKKYISWVRNKTIGVFDTIAEADEAVKFARSKLMPHSKEAELFDSNCTDSVYSKKHLTQPRSQNKSGHRNVYWKKSNNSWGVNVMDRHVGYTKDLNEAVIMAEEARKMHEYYTGDKKIK